MRIIISPAKKMNIDPDSLAVKALPQFLPEANQLLAAMRALDYAQLKSLWHTSDNIALPMYRQLTALELSMNLTPAIIAYEGIQYRYMAPSIFETQQLVYIEEHLRILSGFYGLLRPFDGIVPYRLELQAKLATGTNSDLYSFWGAKLAQQLSRETDLILNLASQEYSRIITKHLPPTIRCITCTFGDWQDDKIKAKGTLCKMARGEMVRWLAEHQLTRPDDLKYFNRLSYTYQPTLSTPTKLVFIKQNTPNRSH